MYHKYMYLKQSILRLQTKDFEPWYKCLWNSEYFWQLIFVINLDQFKQKVMADEHHNRRVTVKRGGRGGNSRYNLDRRPNRNQYQDLDAPERSGRHRPDAKQMSRPNYKKSVSSGSEITGFGWPVFRQQPSTRYLSYENFKIF